MTHTYERTPSNSISETIYYAVADARDCDPLDLPPLVRSVDTDALDAFVDESNGLTEFTAVFQYADCEIVVDNGHVSVEVSR